MGRCRVTKCTSYGSYSRREGIVMKRKLWIMALAGIALVPVAAVQAQTGPFEDLLNTWVLFENPEGSPPVPIEMTHMDLSTSPIPPDFFGPGSDPFAGVIPLRGLHDGTQPGNTDTIIRRQSDPIQPTDPPGTMRTIPIEMVQLRLVSVQPITVTGSTPDFQVDSFFDVFVELSPTVPSAGQLTAIKTHNNGGTFDSFFDITYRMTFTNVSDPTDVRVFDSGMAGQPPLHLEIAGAPWVHQVTIPELIFDPMSQFHPFVQDDGTGVQTEAPVGAQTLPGAPGPIVLHTICLPNIIPVCIYQMGCKAAPPGDLVSCPSCPFNCQLYQGAPCPNGTCAVGVSTFCGVTQCCLDFTLVDCRPPLGEPPLPPLTAACSCSPVLGACCNLADGTCMQTTECECVGTWEGPGTTCGPVGACCYDADGDGVNESCTEISEACCADLPGGTFNGAGSVCAGDANGNGIDDSCESTGGNCPLANSWCQSLPNDCVGGIAGDQCWPMSLHVTNQTFPIVDQCGCFSNDCGPIDIQPIGVPPVDASIRCVNSCPDPLEPCVIHYNGFPTTFSGILASQVPLGVKVTCGCPTVTTDACPLPPDIGIPDPCKDRQLTDCQNGVANDLCLPAVAVITSSGFPIAQTCDCYTPGPGCGPVTILGDIVSCQGTCPAPQTGVCVVHANGVSTNLVSVHMGDVPVGASLTCGCSDPPPTDCRPNADATACAPVSCPVASDSCRAKCMSVDPLTGAVSVVDCDCVGIDECHVEVDPQTAQPACVGACPVGQHCEETTTTDPVTGIVTVCCNCVDNTVCAPTANGLSCEQTVCADPSQICLPNVIAVNPLTGQVMVIDCDCVDPDACHVEFDAAQQPFCKGVCPPGETCELSTITSADGTVAYTCDCVPVQTECAPNDIGSDCLPTVCPYPNEICRPTAISWSPITPPVIKACDCVDPEKQCHVEFDAATGPFCVGQCPPGETCQLFGIDTDGDGERDLWSCDCVPISIECGPDPTQTYCNPATCPAVDEFCVPIVIEIDPVNGQVRVVECECVSHSTGGSCHVNYDPTTLAPFCEGDCPPGQICTLFGKDVNGDGINDQFHCGCVPDTIDCGPTPDGLACNPIACPDPTQVCTPKVIQVVPGALPVVLVCDCIDPVADCHVEYDAAQGPHCVGGCPPGQTCELRSIDSDGDGIDDTFGCDCVPDTGTVCEPNATATDCKQTVCPIPGEICRPVLVTIGPNGQTKVVKCDCVQPDLDCHVEFDAANTPYCAGTCPPGETCELLGLDINGDGIDDLFKCECVPPTLECQPDQTGLECKPTICPIPGDICKPKVIQWVPGILPVVQECECVGPDECHIELDVAAQQPFCTGGCPPGEECLLSGKDSDNDGILDYWECLCVPPSVECSPMDDGSKCKDTVCPVAGEICLPSVIGLLGGFPIVEACDCVSPNMCHLEFDATGPVCVGDCPPGMICRLFGFVDAAGLEHYLCKCIPDNTVCQPTADGQTCSQSACPAVGEKCVPTHVSCPPGAACVVSQCDCGDPELCHVNLAPPNTNPPAICEGVCPPGTTCVLQGTDTDGDGIRDEFHCKCIIKPIVVAVDSTFLKSRFFTIARPGGVAAAANEAIRVRAVSLDGFPAFDGEVRWLGAPQDFPEENSGTPGLTFKASRLECDPLFRDWSADGVVQVYGGLLVPSSQYVVQAVDISCPDLEDENCYSDVAVILTGKFGDIVDPFFVNPGDIQPDFKDISAAVAKFLGDPNAPIKARVQQQPNTPFVARPIDFKDINFVVRAFLGEAYANVPGITGPCPCPSTVTCGATACTTNTVCNGGLCVDGFCRDACQHCTP